MKVTFRQAHLSITGFDEIDLPDFSVITGKNGTGKTHFLEGMAQNMFEIKNNEKPLKNQVYFNYNDFTVKKTPPKGNNNQPPNLKKFQEQKNIQSDLESIKNEIHSNFSPIEEKYRSQDGELFSKIYTRLVTQNIEFLNKWPSANAVLKQLQKDFPDSVFDEVKVLEIYNALKDGVDLIKNIKGITRYYVTSKLKKVHLLNLQPQQFIYHESFLGSQLENTFKDYRSKEAEYDGSLSERKRNGADVNFEEEHAKFTKSHGPAPWKMLNAILKEYDCNNYLLEEKQITKPQYFQTKEQYQINISLRNQSTNKVVPIENLSSGEKTLFALAVTIYQQQKDGNLPELLLLDEVDASLHPSMTKQLLSVLKNLFVKEYGMKIVLVTHSPSTIAHAEDEDIFVMGVEGSKHFIKKESKETALRILSDGFMTFEEGIKILNANKPYVHFEGSIDTDYVKKAKTFGLDTENILEKADLNDLGGEPQLKTHFKSLEKVLDKITIPEKHIYAFDCDVDVEECDRNNLLFKRKITLQEENPIAKGIENLFSKETLEKAIAVNSSFVIKKTTTTNCGDESSSEEIWEINPDQKRNLCDWLCENGTKDDFKNFEVVFEMIKNIVAPTNS